MAHDPAVAYPMLLEPRYLEKPWGGRRLATAFGRALPDDALIGESWELFDMEGGSSRILNGPLKDRSLGDFAGRRRVPLMLKLLDVHENLSVQVHPTIERARIDGTATKTEAWVVLTADDNSRIWRGFKEGVDEAALRAAVKNDSVPDLLHSFKPREGDVIFVPAGMVHALGGGLLLAEIQQSSDATYRIWDWGREASEDRPHHLEAAIASLDFRPAGPPRVLPEELEDDGNLRRLRLVASRWFSAEHWTGAGTATFTTSRGEEDCWHVLLFLRGRGVVRAFDRRAAPCAFGPGDTILVPAVHDHYEIEPLGGGGFQALAFHEGSGAIRVSEAEADG
ncbi:MAG: type I phosphomannose isomerase catalytic subunit [Planctomycetota bacterium]